MRYRESPLLPSEVHAAVSGETAWTLNPQAYLRSFTDEPVAEIVQCGEPSASAR
jgi:hypothetical protein